MQKQRIEHSFRRATQSYPDKAVAQRHIVEHLVRLIPEKIKQCPNGRLLEIGCGSGFLTEKLAEIFRDWTGTINDLSPSWQPIVEPILNERKWSFEVGDAECFPFSGKFDLIVSSNTIQWFDDPSEFIARALEQLTPQGVLLISTFGKRNLHEIRTLTGSGLFYPSVAELRSELPANTIAEHYEEEIVLEFESPLAVLKHLRQTGVNGVTAEVWSKGRLEDFSTQYRKMSGRSSGVSLTYHPVYLVVNRI